MLGSRRPQMTDNDFDAPPDVGERQAVAADAVVLVGKDGQRVRCLRIWRGPVPYIARVSVETHLSPAKEKQFRRAVALVREDKASLTRLCGEDELQVRRIAKCGSICNSTDGHCRLRSASTSPKSRHSSCLISNSRILWEHAQALGAPCRWVSEARLSRHAGHSLLTRVYS
jgi:hypothetical protein